jgi:hypothetical protein
MNAVTLGECLRTADRHFTAAMTPHHGGILDHASSVRELHRLVAVMARCLDAATGDASILISGSSRNDWERTASEQRAALHLAADCLDEASAQLGEPDRTLADQHLAEAADALAAGGDLLRTHVAVNPDGLVVERSDWARLMTCQPVVAAMTEEMTKWSLRAASWAALLARGAEHGGHEQLAAASKWLETSVAVNRPAGTAGLEAAMRTELLHAFPLASPPERIPPDRGESAAGLCDAIAVSAERLRAIAFAMPGQASWSPDVSGPAWLRTAHGAAIVSDIAGLALQALGERSAQLGKPPVSAEGLYSAAASFGGARSAWGQVTGLWRTMTTDTQSPLSTASRETDDLVVRMGRLVFRNPEWTPARDQRAPLHDPASLAPDGDALISILGAVHQAADAIARMARGDLEAIKAVGSVGRLYMSNRILEEENTAARSYLVAPGDRVHLLQDVYKVTISASQRAARALDSLAMESRAPSRVLALARTAASGANTGRPNPADELNADELASRLRYFTRPKRDLTRRHSDIDAGAVLRARQEQGLTLQQCADRFTTTKGTITKILRENGIQPYVASRGPNEAPAYPSASTGAHAIESPRTSPVPPLTQLGRKRSPGSIEHQIRTMGVNDPGLLLRAAAIDKAAVELIAQASKASSDPVNTGPASQQRRHRGNAARLADKDVPLNASTKQDPRSTRSPRRPTSRQPPMFTGSQDTPIPRVTRHSP